VSYSFIQCEFTLINEDDVKFASGKIEKLRGSQMVYSNREAKTDLDIDRITLYNHIDSEEYQMVLYPGI